MPQSELENAIKKKAIGYQSDEVVMEYQTDETGELKLVKKKVTSKEFPPDVTAAKTLLETSQQEDDVLTKLTDEQLKNELEKLLALLN